MGKCINSPVIENYINFRTKLLPFPSKMDLGTEKTKKTKITGFMHGKSNYFY
jgi:hypothetical protein